MWVVTEQAGYEDVDVVGYILNARRAAAFKAKLSPSSPFAIIKVPEITAMSVLFELHLDSSGYKYEYSTVEFAKVKPTPATVVSEKSQRTIIREAKTKKRKRKLDSRSHAVTSLYLGSLAGYAQAGDHAEVIVRGSDPAQVRALARERIRKLKARMRKDRFTEPNRIIEHDPDQLYAQLNSRSTGVSG